MAVEYEVQWRRGNQGWNVNNRQAETTATMYTITNLSPATYQVRVRAVRDGVPGLWSIPLSAVVTSGTILVATVRADDASIEQGETADFTITLSPAPQSATDVNVTVSATGNVVLPVNQGAFVQSVGTGGTAAYSVATVSGEAGSVTLAIAAGGYSIGSPSSAVVSVLRFVLYMVGFDNDLLYTVDRATGVATAVDSNINDFSVSEGTPTGLAWDGSTLYMVGVNNRRLYTVDRATGVATAVDSNITNFGVSESSPQGLAWDGSTLYMVGASGRRLYTVDRATGVATAVDSNITQFGVSEGTPIGLAWDGSTLYMVGRGLALLYTVDRATGVATAVDSNITNFGVSEGDPQGLAWDGSTLYMVGRGLDLLYTVDRATGVATAVDSNINDFGVSEGDPSGLAWVPEIA